MESVDQRPAIPVFPYDTSVVWDAFASLATVQAATLGSHVSLVLRVLMVEEKQTQDKLEPYLVVHGVDMDNIPIPPLRLWRFGPSDVQEGCCYIMRGLKIVLEKYWDDGAWKWLPRMDGQKAVECIYRTAAEDVTHVPGIMAFFK